MSHRQLLKRLALGAALLLPLAAGVGVANAIVVDMNATGQTTVPFNSANQSGYYGVAMVPGTATDLATAGVPEVTSSATCTDPWLSSDFALPANGLCYNGGPVMHANEVFALTWDPARRYFATTRNYMETFLQNVAAGSGQLTSPYAVTPQYQDGSGRAAYKSTYGGGCVDFGQVGGYTCQFPGTATQATGIGNNYPAQTCTPSGDNQYHEELDSSFDIAPNDICLTDSDVQAEVTRIASDVNGQFKAGYTPTIDVLLPPGVVVCLNSASSLCSANSNAAARFCSYHGEINGMAYVVQPWVAGFSEETGCDESELGTIVKPGDSEQIDATVLANGVGQRLVSPLSQAQIASITDPGMNAWFASDGTEINDHGCVPVGTGQTTTTTSSTTTTTPATTLDAVTVNGTGYELQREFNNGGVIETDPNAPSCAPKVAFSPAFVVPTGANPGDIVQFDGSTSVTTLLISKANYQWNFGDGSTATGPSVAHSYANTGTYTVTLTVTDRGGNTAQLQQQVVIGTPATTTTTTTSTTTTTTSTNSGTTTTTSTQPTTTGTTTTKKPTKPGRQAFTASLRLLPQGLREVLRSGIVVDVRSDEAADGIATVLIPRATARRVHIKATGHSGPVAIGRTTVSGIVDGTARVRLALSRSVRQRLSHLKRVTLTIRLTLIDHNNNHVTVDAAGRY